MKNVNSYILHGISFCLFSVFAITNPTVVNAQPKYNLETDHMSMEDLGALLERMGEEIQWKGQVTIGGNTYPVKGFGSIEMSVGPRRRGGGSSIEFEISAAGREGVPRGTTYISYDRGGMRMAPKEFAEIVAKIGKTLDSKGIFALDHHNVAFEGKAKVVQLLTRTNRQMGRQRASGSNYSYKFDIMFGQNDFPTPEDELEDIKSLLPEERELQGLKELGKKEVAGADQKAVAKLINSLSSDLKAGRLRVGDEDLKVAQNIGCGYSHLIARDGKSHRVQLALTFTDGPPQSRRPSGPRYGEEFINKPIKQIGALLKRLGTEILEDETMKLGENDFSVGQKASYEISSSSRGFEISVQYTEPPKEK